MKLSQAKNIVAASIDSQIQNATGRDAQRVIPYLIGGAGLGKAVRGALKGGGLCGDDPADRKRVARRVERGTEIGKTSSG